MKRVGFGRRAGKHDPGSRAPRDRALRAGGVVFGLSDAGVKGGEPWTCRV